MSGHVFWDVDTQVDFMLPHGRLYVPGAETIRRNLARLTRFAHRQSIRIVASSDSHAPDDAELAARPDFVDTFPPHCLAGSTGQARVPETTLDGALVIEPDDDPAATLRRLAGHDGDILFHKRFFDVFTNPSVDPVVQALRLDRVTLYGVALDVCNRYAIEGLLARYPGIAVTVVTDAVRAIDEGRRSDLFRDWGSRGVAFCSTDEATKDP